MPMHFQQLCRETTFFFLTRLIHGVDWMNQVTPPDGLISIQIPAKTRRGGYLHSKCGVLMHTHRWWRLRNLIYTILYQYPKSQWYWLWYRTYILKKLWIIDGEYLSLSLQHPNVPNDSHPQFLDYSLTSWKSYTSIIILFYMTCKTLHLIVW
jgi:hypothetical protein